MKFETLGRKVAVKYPELVEELLVPPLLTNKDLIPEVLNKQFAGKEIEKYEVIAVVLRLFDPEVLEGYKSKVMPGTRTNLSNYFGVSGTAISNNVASIKNYWHVYRKFKEKVEDMAFEIAGKYQ